MVALDLADMLTGSWSLVGLALEVLQYVTVGKFACVPLVHPYS